MQFILFSLKQLQASQCSYIPIIPIYLRNLLYFLYLTFSFYFLYFHVTLHPCFFLLLFFFPPFFFLLLPDKHSGILPIFWEIMSHLCIRIQHLKNILEKILFWQLVAKNSKLCQFSVKKKNIFTQKKKIIHLKNITC